MQFVGVVFVCFLSCCFFVLFQQCVGWDGMPRCALVAAAALACHPSPSDFLFVLLSAFALM